MKRRLSQDRRGIAVVEFALALPVLLMCLMGIFLLGMLFHANSGIRELMGSAGRSAIIGFQSATPPTEAAFAATIVADAGSGYGIEKARLVALVDTDGDDDDGKNGMGNDTVESPTGDDPSVRMVTITITYPFTIEIPLMPALTVNLQQQRSYYAPL